MDQLQFCKVSVDQISKFKMITAGICHQSVELTLFSVGSASFENELILKLSCSDDGLALASYKLVALGTWSKELRNLQASSTGYLKILF